MSIYNNTNYRHLYKKHHGFIPKDDSGRTYDIHHLDGNRLNNDISNLIALSIQEHYDLHYSQGDWAACLRIAARMKVSHLELRELAIKINQEKIKNGTHHLVGGKIQKKHSSSNQKKLVAEGRHHFLGPEINKKRVENGTHNFLGSSLQNKRVQEGTHPFLGNKFAKENNKKRLNNGTHHFLVNHPQPAKIRVSCMCCKKESSLLMFNRWHGNKCKYLNL